MRGTLAYARSTAPGVSPSRPEAQDRQVTPDRYRITRITGLGPVELRHYARDSTREAEPECAPGEARHQPETRPVSERPPHGAPSAYTGRAAGDSARREASGVVEGQPSGSGPGMPRSETVTRMGSGDAPGETDDGNTESREHGGPRGSARCPSADRPAWMSGWNGGLLEPLGRSLA